MRTLLFALFLAVCQSAFGLHPEPNESSLLQGDKQRAVKTYPISRRFCLIQNLCLSLFKGRAKQQKPVETITSPASKIDEKKIAQFKDGFIPPSLLNLLLGTDDDRTYELLSDYVSHAELLLRRYIENTDALRDADDLSKMQYVESLRAMSDVIQKRGHNILFIKALCNPKTRVFIKNVVVAATLAIKYAEDKAVWMIDTREGLDPIFPYSFTLTELKVAEQSFLRAIKWDIAPLWIGPDPKE